MQLGCHYAKPEPKPRFSRLKLGLRLWLLAMLLGLGWGGFRLYLRWTRVPQAVLVLGGSPEREVFAADFARTHPELEVWVSGEVTRNMRNGCLRRRGFLANASI